MGLGQFISLFPIWCQEKTNIHTKVYIQRPTLIGKEGGILILGFKTGSMSLCEGEGGKLRYQCDSTILSFPFFCFLLPLGWSDGAQCNASVQEEICHHFAV